MDFDFKPYFQKYRQISKLADEAFARIQQDYTTCVKCRLACSDCCHALFDLSLIEALYINKKFKGLGDDQLRREIVDKANQADRRIIKIKRQAQNAVKAGENEEKVLIALGDERVRCPLLNDQNECDLYEHRPIICRLYGIPLNIGGKARTCGLSEFKEGTPYPSVHMDAIQSRLYNLSAELVRDLNSKYSGLIDMLVPVSMALLNEYDENYLGVKRQAEGDKESLGGDSHDK